jgi:hypothetical protein
MKRIFATIFLLTVCLGLFAQTNGVGINETGNDPEASAILDVQSTGKGFLMPRMTSGERDAITNPAAGLYIFNTDDSCFNYFTGLEWVIDCGAKKDIFQAPSAPIQAGGSGFARGQAIGSDKFGNMYVAGVFDGTLSLGTYSLVPNGVIDVFLVKYRPNGEVIWAKNAGGSSSDVVYDLAVDAAGNCFLTGSFKGTATFGSLSTSTSGGSFPDAFVAKYDPDGQELWVENFGGVSNDIGYGVAVDDAGYCYATGRFGGAANFGGVSLSSPGSFDFDVYIAKIDPDGQVIWAQSLGGPGGSKGNGISVDAAGNCFVTGDYEGSLTSNNLSLTSSGQKDIFLAKYNTSGQFVWARSAGGSGNDIGNGVATDAAGNAYITGQVEGAATFGSININAVGEDGFLFKYSPSGQELLGTSWGGPTTTDNEAGEAISIDAAGNVYVTGSCFQNISLGSIPPPPAKTGLAAYVVKHNANGQAIWAKLLGGDNGSSGYAEGYDISVNEAGNTYSTGRFNGTVAAGDFSLVNAGMNQELFVWSLDGNNGEPLLVDITNLSGLQDLDADPENELQQLSINNTQLSITNGNTVDLISIQDNLGDHIATQNLQLNGNYLSGDGDAEGIFVNSFGKVGMGTNDPKNRVDIEGGLAVGTDYSGSQTAPVDGAIIQGKVGIGTNDPKNRVDIEGGLAVGTDYSGSQTAPVDGAIIQGKVGMGTNDPKNRVDIEGGLALGSGYSGSFTAPADGAIIQGKVGIGVNAPVNALDVGGGLVVGFGYSTNYTAPVNGALFEGNVGIALPVPGKKLDVNGNGRFSAIGSEQLTIVNPFNFASQPVEIYLDRTILGSTQYAKIGVGNTSRDFYISYNGADRLTINENGDLGIGITTPGQKLDVNGKGRFTAEGAKQVIINNTGANSGDPAEIYFDRTTLGNEQQSAIGVGSTSRDFFIWHNGSDRLNIKENGNVVIGNNLAVGTTDFAGRKMRVVGNTELDGKVYFTSNLLTGALGGFDIVCVDAGGGKYEVRRQISSRRYKDNITDLDLGADRLLDLNLKSWTAKGDHSGKTGIGYIAEEVDSMGLKELVLYNEDGVVESLKFSYFPFYSLELIKKHRSRIVTLEDQLEVTNKDNETLKKALKNQQTEIDNLKKELDEIKALLSQNLSPSAKK